MQVLVVEDDVSLSHAMSSVLREEGFQVHASLRGDDGLFMAEQNIYDLIILDMMLPGMSGISIIHYLRSRKIDTPILLLTALDAVERRVEGLDAGADDYVVKPVAFQELLARARAILRRHGTLSESGDISVGPISVRPRLQEGFVHDTALKLSAKEFELLEFLVINRNQILTREQILDRVWGFESDTGIGIVDLYIHYLRKKLAGLGCPEMIHTVRGIGYMLKEKPHVPKNEN
ncbi:response regulator transcription factor [Paenibacillus sp. LHD-117]|uniref:response regulator transcription factor n=1 Tax=Paenibacillus sp. LHD-117 TaxID=3071412 RepID=UPI0027E0DA51|nr:response regulator transcription factor [Paenibacillus sp. LHD-117]MDQ6422390.1 response regulator transcription factor [Paenibacillus sp. LHD-117]